MRHGVPVRSDRRRRVRPSVAADRAAGDHRLHELLRAPGGLLLDASPGGSATRLAAGWAGRVIAVPGPEDLLIRPDGIVAWGGPTIGAPPSAASTRR
jgi:hypothetical protein